MAQEQANVSVNSSSTKSDSSQKGKIISNEFENKYIGDSRKCCLYNNPPFIAISIPEDVKELEKLAFKTENGYMFKNIDVTMVSSFYNLTAYSNVNVKCTSDEFGKLKDILPLEYQDFFDGNDIKRDDYDNDEKDEKKVEVKDAQLAKASIKQGKEASSSSSSSASSEQQLVILMACWGGNYPTSIIRAKILNNSVSLTANKETLGETVPNPALVVVFAYTNGIGVESYKTGVAIAQENQVLTINSSTPTPYQVDASLSKSNTLQIMGAVIDIGTGVAPKDVTTLAQSKIANNEVNVPFTASEWNITGELQFQTIMYMVYSYNGIPYRRTITCGNNKYVRVYQVPTLNILGAGYGPVDITQLISSAISQNSVIVPNWLFGNPTWKGLHACSFIYQYDGYEPNTTVSRSSFVGIDFVPGKETPRKVKSVNPTDLTIYGATWGVSVVTSTLQNLVKEPSNDSSDILNVVANESTFGDGGAPNENKMLTVVYGYGNQLTKTVMVEQGDTLKVTKNLHSSFTQYNTINLFDMNDELYVTTSFGFYAVLNNDNTISYTNDKTKATLFKVIQKNSDESVVLSSANGAGTFFGSIYSMTDKNGNLYFKTNTGPIINEYDNVKNVWISKIDSDNTTKNAFYNSLCQFNIEFLAVAVQSSDENINPHLFLATINKLNEKNIKMANMFESDCSVKLASLVWSLTGGFLSATGIIPYIKTDKVHTGLYALIRTNAKIAAAIDQIAQLALNNVTITASLAANFLQLLYSEGLLWTVVKFILQSAGWWALGKVIAKILLWIGVPELELAELAASMAIWVAQLSINAYNYATCQNNSNGRLLTFKSRKEVTLFFNNVLMGVVGTA